MRVKYFFFIIFITNTLISLSQNKVKIFENISFESDFGYGSVLPHHKAIEYCVEDHIKNFDIDSLSVKAEPGDNFLSLINLLSESYHYILYSLPSGPIELNQQEYINPAHQVYLLVSQEKYDLKRSSLGIKRLIGLSPLNKEKIKIILIDPKSSEFSFTKNHLK